MRHDEPRKMVERNREEGKRERSRLLGKRARGFDRGGITQSGSILVAATGEQDMVASLDHHACLAEAKLAEVSRKQASCSYSFDSLGPLRTGVKVHSHVPISHLTASSLSNHKQYDVF